MYQILKKHSSAIATLSLSIALLIALAIQYPLSVHYPMGGDAPAYIIVVKNILSAPLARETWYVMLYSWYPLAHLSFLPFSLLPISWPMRFVWWAAIGQIAVGAAMGWMLYRVFGWRTAAAGIALWAFTPIVATKHFEDGTIAQLWSYVPLLLFIERWHSKKFRLAIVLLLVTFFAHVITGLVLFISIFCALFSVVFVHKRISLPHKKEFMYFVLIVFGLAVMGALLLFMRRTVFSNVLGGSDITFFDVYHSLFQPILILFPIGLFLLGKKLRAHPLTLIFIFSFIFISALLAFNSLIGVSVWEKRLLPLFVIAVCLSAAVTLSFLFEHISRKPIIRAALAVALVIVMFTQVWPNNRRVYKFYESPSRYARIHPLEVDAINWMKNGVPARSVIIVSNANRHSEWIPVFTDHQINIVSEAKILHFAEKESDPNIYLVFFTKRESVPQTLKDSPDFLRVFANDAVIITRVNHD